MRLVTTQQMRNLEQAAVDAGATWDELMQRAGHGVASIALQHLAQTGGRRAMVLVGPGNNGGDGLVVARHLHDAAIRVVLYVWRRTDAASDANWHACRERGIREVAAADDPAQAQLHSLLVDTDLVVDALLGMGTTRPVTDLLATIVAAVNDIRTEQHYAVLAVDVPTGVQSDSGALLATAVRADSTVATGALKRGLVAYPGRAYTGDIALAEIGIPAGDMEAIMTEQITDVFVRERLPQRPEDSHKGTFGKAMIVAGSLRYPGAAILATGGAQRVGAGLVTLATGRSTLAVSGRMPEVTVLPLPEASWGVVGPEAAQELQENLEGYTALLIGPGLGREEPTRVFLQRIFGLEQARARSRVGFTAGRPLAQAQDEAKSVDLPATVIDADGLNLLSEIDGWAEHLPKNHFVLTPHPGEMKRLLKTETLDDDSIQVASAAAENWGQVVVLKGATTVIAAPDGRTLVHTAANPALATAGTGDVLAGAIVGLLAQGVALFDAAALGVYLHSAAGLLLREDLGDAGTIASDLFTRLPRAIHALKELNG